MFAAIPPNAVQKASYATSLMSIYPGTDLQAAALNTRKNVLRVPFFFSPMIPGVVCAIPIHRAIEAPASVGDQLVPPIVSTSAPQAAIAFKHFLTCFIISA